MRRGAAGRAPLARLAVCLGALAGAGLAARAGEADAAAESLLREARRDWPKLDRDAKLALLTRLGAHPSGRLLAQCGKWLADPDPDAVVAGQVVRLVAVHAADGRNWRRIEAILTAHARSHLDALERRAAREFKRVCREFGDEVPPGDQMAAGSNWADPWDEDRRALPADVRAERAHMFEVIAALEPIHTRGHVAVLLEVFRRHPDPEVLVRAAQLFGRWKEWRALPAMADLARIQEFGREMGGADVIGREKYETLRLKWDVHKDRLWWSRPEYVPRVKHPVYEAASAITGAAIDSAAALDRWMLAHERELARHGVRLTAAFRARARSSQR